MARNRIYFHYDGPIAVDHKVTVRTLGHTLAHLQAAIDRAAIEIKYGSVAKHGRLRSADYPLTDFVVGEPEEGGYILNLFNSGPLKIVDRINAAIARAYVEASSEVIPFTESLVKQAERSAAAVHLGAQNPAELTTVLAKMDERKQNARYADRAINREIDQLLSQVRVDRYSGSVLELQFAGESTSPMYSFDKNLATRFHNVVAVRTLGDPVRLNVKLRALDGGSSTNRSIGKAIHVESGKTFTLHFRSPEDFNSVVPYMRANKRPAVAIVACPVLEYGVFDSKAGDMFFVGLDR